MLAIAPLNVVALLAEGVDRNFPPDVDEDTAAMVALLAEGVDRNFELPEAQPDDVEVALLAEGVDRNLMISRLASTLRLSPSSRRAWIEMAGPAYQHPAPPSRPPRGGRG